MYRIILPCLMGLESVLGRELVDLGFAPEQIHKENAQVLLDVDQEEGALSRAIARCNICLRTAERVLLEVATFPAANFDDLFDRVVALPWNNWIQRGEAFTVDGYTRKSQLFAPRALQSTLKKAMVLSLCRAWRLPEDSLLAEDPQKMAHHIRYRIMKDQVSLSFDTSGENLHKRGYRPLRNLAPIKETLAAGILGLSHYSGKPDELLYDPCCGTGTFLLEGALMAGHIAPGKNRRFRAEDWSFLTPGVFTEVREEAVAEEDLSALQAGIIAGSDFDQESLLLAHESAKLAGLDEYISLEHKDLRDLDLDELRARFDKPEILLVANPPYGERMGSKALAQDLNRCLAHLALAPDAFYTKPHSRFTVITSRDFEADTGRRADRRRKLYNGSLVCTAYLYFRSLWLPEDRGKTGRPG